MSAQDRGHRIRPAGGMRRRIGAFFKAWNVAPLCLVLSACVSGTDFVPGGKAVTAMPVAGGALTVAGPRGYCIDRGSSRSGREGAFVLFGSCAALAGPTASGPAGRPALLTVAVLPNAPESAAMVASFPVLGAYFRSSAGRAALSRSGRAETVTILEVQLRDDVLYLHINDSSPASGAAVETEYWRAISALRGQMVTFSALGLADRPSPSADDKRRVLEALVAAVKAANAKSAAG